jgi:hypothetical protein
VYRGLTVKLNVDKRAIRPPAANIQLGSFDVCKFPSGIAMKGGKPCGAVSNFGEDNVTATITDAGIFGK